VDNKTKRRLVVAVIIIALAVIFLPIPFSKKKHPVATSFRQIPKAPEVQKPEQTQDVTPDTIAKKFHAEGEVIPESPLPDDSASQPSDDQTQSTESDTVTSTSSTPEQKTTVPETNAPEKAAPAPTASPQKTESKPSAPPAKEAAKPSPKPKPVKHYSQNTTMVETNTGLPSDPDLDQPLPADDNTLPPPPFDQKRQAATPHHANKKASHHTKTKKDQDAVMASNTSVLAEYKNKGEKPLLIRESDFSPLSKIDIRKQNASSANVVDYKKRLQMAEKQNHAYVLQLASFDDIKPARHLVAKLRNDGYVAFVQKAKIHGKLMHRVYVGPFTEKQKAQALEHTIRHKLHMKGYVHYFTPTVMVP